jgi:hypothetical protein
MKMNNILKNGLFLKDIISSWEIIEIIPTIALKMSVLSQEKTFLAERITYG